MNWGKIEWLWALILLPIFYWSLKTQIRKKIESIQLFAQLKLLDRLFPELSLRAANRKIVVFLVALTFLVLTLARPRWGFNEEKIEISGIDLVIAIDVSNSMLAEDVAPSRLKQAQHFTRKILEQLGTDRVGLIAFAGSAHLVSPLTTDYDYIQESLGVLSPEMIPDQGTDLAAALKGALVALKRGAELVPTEQSRSSATKGPISRAVLLITDGEGHEGNPSALAKELKNLGVDLMVIGIGTPSGGPIPLKDPSGNLIGYKREGKEAILTHLNTTALEGLAAKADGHFWAITGTDFPTSAVMEVLHGMEKGPAQEKKVTYFEERFQIPLAIAIILLALEMSINLRRRTALLIFFSIFSFLNKNSVIAASLPAYLKNEKGIEAYQKGEYQVADQYFREASEADPTSGVGDFNQGLTQASVPVEGKDSSQASGQAADFFLKAAEKAKNSGNLPLEGRALFNRGSALAKAGNRQAAIDSWVQAIENAKQTKDTELENIARQRIQQIAVEPPPPPPQPQGGKDDQKKEKQPEQEGIEKKQGAVENDPNSKEQSLEKKPDGTEKIPEQEKEKGPKDQGKKFDSPQLSQEDAEKVMADLLDHESTLQKKLNKKQQEKKSETKDW